MTFVLSKDSGSYLAANSSYFEMNPESAYDEYGICKDIQFQLVSLGLRLRIDLYISKTEIKNVFSVNISLHIIQSSLI